MEKKGLLYEGKAKKMYATTQDDLLIVEYKDDATAFNGLKKGQIAGKGILNNKIAAYFFELLAQNGVESHFVRQLSEKEMLVKKLEMLKVEVVVRNKAAGSLAKRFGVAEGTALKEPVLEFYYKDDELEDPIINEYHIYAFEIATKEQVVKMAQIALRINEILIAKLKGLNLELIDFKIEFGTLQGEVILGDEISPDSCRFWDTQTQEKLDKDRFRRDLGNVAEAYQEILNRLTGTNV